MKLCTPGDGSHQGHTKVHLPHAYASCTAVRSRRTCGSKQIKQRPPQHLGERPWLHTWTTNGLLRLTASPHGGERGRSASGARDASLCVKCVSKSSHHSSPRGHYDVTLASTQKKSPVAAKSTCSFLISLQPRDREHTMDSIMCTGETEMQTAEGRGRAREGRYFRLRLSVCVSEQGRVGAAGRVKGPAASSLSCLLGQNASLH